MRKILTVLSLTLIFIVYGSNNTVFASSCSGYVKDADGKPLSGVALECTGNTVCSTVPTNPNGLYTYRITDQAGFPYTVTFKLDGYKNKEVVVTDNMGCAGSAFMEKIEQVGGWGCVNNSCAKGTGTFTTEGACKEQCPAPPSKTCCKTTTAGENVCTTSGCKLSDTLFDNTEACTPSCVTGNGFKCMVNTANEICLSPGDTGNSPPCLPGTLGCYATLSLCQSGCKAPKLTPIYLCLLDSCSTGLGKISTRPGGFITSMLTYALMFAGLALIITLISVGYKVLTSAGNPEKIQAAKEMTTSLFAGIVLIVFSLILLQTIGVDILSLPGFK